MALAALVLVAALPLVHMVARPVLTSSMEPTMPAGSLVVTRSVDPGQITVGEVVTFTAGDNFVTHRVVKDSVDGDATLLRTQGDASSVMDDPIARDRVVGAAVLDVPWLGRGLLTIQSPAGFLGVVLGPLFLILLGQLLRRGPSRRTGPKTRPVPVEVGP